MSALCCLYCSAERARPSFFSQGRDAGLPEVNKPGGKSNRYSGLEASVPTVTLPPSKLKGEDGLNSGAYGHGNPECGNRSGASD